MRWVVSAGGNGFISFIAVTFVSDIYTLELEIQFIDHPAPGRSIVTGTPSAGSRGYLQPLCYYLVDVTHMSCMCRVRTEEAGKLAAAGQKVAVGRGQICYTLSISRHARREVSSAAKRLENQSGGGGGTRKV